MHVPRTLHSTLSRRMFGGKAIVVIGARQVGKSTLCGEVVAERTEPVLSLNCDDPAVRAMLTGANTEQLRQLIGPNKIVLVDEAQRIQGIGLTLKLITDTFRDVQLIVTGSSSYELLSSVDEPLTGRVREYRLFPISTAEMVAAGGVLLAKQTLEQRLIYGSYPEVVANADEARETLMGIAQSYLYKDVMAMEGIRKPAMLERLLVALALQVGAEVSYNELAQTVGSDAKTIEKYIDVLEKSYIVFRLPALSRNLRNELKKSRKVYFYDNGIRNAVLQNFAPVSLRGDMGALWENFFVGERMKYNSYAATYAKMYFWRTTARQEIDLVEETDGRFAAYEMKWNPRKADTTLPAAFMNSYDVDKAAVVTPENYTEYLI